jgi:hydrogenase nickel incorporation protein HypA/HybF
MHELGLVLELVKLAANELERGGHTGRVERLNLTVGVLSGASPEALRAAFGVVAETRGWNGAELNITEAPARCACSVCGARCDVRTFVLACPVCGDPLCTMEGGHELQLTSIDLAD